MEPPNNRELDLILSRGEFRGPFAEQVRERVLDALEPTRTPRRRLLRFVVPILAAAAAVSIAVVRLAPQSADPAFRPKGASAGAPALLGLTCSNGTPAGCHRGARVSLAFAPGTTGHLGVYADPEGGGARIWYFSREDGEASLIGTENGGDAVPSRSILLGPEHAAGSYRVHVVVASRPLNRVEILDPATAGVRIETSVPMTVLDP